MAEQTHVDKEKTKVRNIREWKRQYLTWDLKKDEQLIWEINVTFITLGFMNISWFYFFNYSFQTCPINSLSFALEWSYNDLVSVSYENLVQSVSLILQSLGTFSSPIPSTHLLTCSFSGIRMERKDMKIRNFAHTWQSYLCLYIILDILFQSDFAW